MIFAVHSARTNIMYINQEKRKGRTAKMIENRNVNIITDADGKKLVLINDIRFKGKRQIEWDDVKQYLEGYVGDYYEIAENAEHIFIGNELPEEYTESESRKSLMGANAKAKANAATAIPELIQIATNPTFEENRKEKHNKNAKFGWYRYDVRFALPVYEENILVRYNIFHARLLINHAENGRKYLYDILAIKKETSKP
jgi:hypothetical protein